MGGVEEDFVAGTAGIRVPSFQCPTRIQASRTVLSQVLLFCVYPSDLLSHEVAGELNLPCHGG